MELRRAVTEADYVRFTLPRMARLVDAALADVRRAAEIGAIGVSYSGGKDSTVTLDLVRRVVPDAPAALFDSGCELRGTLALVEHYGAEVVQPRMTFPEMARYSGWWGYPHPVDEGCPFRVKTVIVYEPAEAWVVKRRLRVQAMGLRQEESRARRISGAIRGTLYEVADRTWNLCPIQRWKVDDVWAYIAGRGLRYHSAYDAMTEMGIPRKEQRLGALLGEIGEATGSFAKLRRIEPETWEALAREFPLVRMRS